MFGKKSKELTVLTQLVSFTNMKILVNKGICTNEEWEEASQSVILAIQDMQKNRGDMSSLIEALQEREDDYDE